ncbi:MAG: phosphotransferase [Tetrasphaera sp.]
MPQADAVHAACVEISGLGSADLAGVEVPALNTDVATGWGIETVFAVGDADRPLARIPQALAGERLCHTGLRPDNLLIADNDATVIDWNWVCSGPPWADFVCL